MRCEIKQSLDFRCPENMDASKKKSVAMIDSNSESDSDMSESEFKNLAKKQKMDTDQVIGKQFHLCVIHELTSLTDKITLSLT